MTVSNLILLAVLGLFVGQGLCATKCWSSNEGTRNAADNGAETTCRDVAGATLRYCIKFNSDSRPGKVFRECDHVYENLFGEDTFKHSGEGCWNYQKKIGEITEKGRFCACKDDNCNSGDIEPEAQT